MTRLYQLIQAKVHLRYNSAYVSNRGPTWSQVAFGLGLLAAVGLIAMLWSRLRSARQTMASHWLNSSAPWHRQLSGPSIQISGPVTVNLPGYGQPGFPITYPQGMVPKADVTVEAPSTQMLASASSATSRSTTMRTMRLQTGSSMRVFTATSETGWRLQLRVLGPPGTVASFSVNSPDNADMLLIPTGGTNEISLAPSDILYGSSTLANTTVSLTASPTPFYG